MQTLHTESNLADRPVPYSMCSNTLYYQWKSPRNSITIRLSLDAVRRLSLVVEGGFRALRTRGLEVGGLLLGTFTPGHGRITVIEDFEPFDSEHRSGPSYLLSERDKEQLENRLAALRTGQHGLGVVGYWRSHTRPGLYLDQEDYSAIQSYFADPSQVFLGVRPSVQEPAVGGFFFWEGGGVYRECPNQIFPFDAARLLAGGFDVLNGANASPIGERGQVTPAAACQGPATAAAPASARAAFRAPASVGHVDSDLPTIAPLAQAALRPAAWQERLGRLHLTWFALGLTSVLMVTAPVIYRVWRHANVRLVPQAVSVQPSTSELLLKLSRETSNALRLSWNRDSLAVRNAVGGVLLISDGGRPVRVDLDKKLLSQGSIVYFPTSGDVDFRVEVSTNGIGVSESVRAVAPVPVVPVPMAPQQPPPEWTPLLPLPTEQPETHAEESVPRVEQTRNPPELPLQEAAGKGHSLAMTQRDEFVAQVPAKHFHPPALKATAGLAGSTSALVLGPPPVHAPSPVGTIPDVLARRSYIVATVAYEPVEPSTLERIVHRIPGLGRFERLPGDENKGFVPPRPRDEISFLASTANGRDLLEKTPIALKIRLNESGKICNVQLLPGSKNNPAASLAVRASLTWQFVPALWKGKAVASELIVRLTFAGSSGSASIHTPPSPGTAGH